ncbi:arylsulfatase [Novipirellula artificiosorum]|uniref:Arylsulfatase n=1 Tax=Novipirellula artificiosorum TaxID=2528016 RepID=A0A5C6DGL7_9BACT|nr:arylsulfatase [Novipirellula artificiosorum]TWU35960.1 Arylsulfatase precursor [Novipirellula artificiosorum]
MLKGTIYYILPSLIRKKTFMPTPKRSTSLVRLFAFLTLVSVAMLGAAERPNVVVILSDDQGWGDLSLNGNVNLSTPKIDSLARDGASFDRFYVCPVCSPTRAEFLTGRYHPRGKVYSTSSGGERLNLDEITIADTFKAAGYATAAFGKWHNGMQYPYHPCGRGFDEYYGFCSGHWGDYFSPMLEHNGQIVQGDGYLTDDFTNHAMQFIEMHQDQPFFVYLPFNTPHTPMQVPDRWWDKFRDKGLTMLHRDSKKEALPFTRAALAMCENIDWNVGRLLEKLDELKLAENTIVLYFCDNGPNSNRWNGGMKGRKGSTDEGGVRSPMVIRWPAAIEPGTQVTQIGGAIDLLPTLADLTGIPIISQKPLDGVSLKPVLLGTQTSLPDRKIFSHWGNRVSVRTPQFRLDHQGKLFDLAADPGQDQDVSAEHPQLTSELKADVKAWQNEVFKNNNQQPRPFLIGHPDFEYTQMPARDAEGSGGIQRSNRWPNCSFLTHWTQLDEAITWNAEVVADGTFEVVLYYTCPAEDVGSRFELSINGSRIEGQITQAQDPPLRGAEHDRVERMESYVKDFRAMNLGTMELEQGPGQLTLRALEIPGTQVMDFRLLMFKRVDSAVD